MSWAYLSGRLNKHRCRYVFIFVLAWKKELEKTGLEVENLKVGRNNDSPVLVLEVTSAPCFTEDIFLQLKTRTLREDDH